MRINAWTVLLSGTLATFLPVIQAPAMAQASGPVTAISELSDVQPTDWAFQALQSLVERYGCIAGYPDRTYRGNRALTRFEFAAGLNACLDRINELLAAGLSDKVTREDLALLQRLQEEFASELAALRGRVDILEEDVADIRSRIFNPVTKLNAQVVTGLVGAALTENRVDPTGRVITDANAANFTFPYRVRLNFDASFVGNDQLRIRLQALNATSPSSVLGGSADPGLSFGAGNSNALNLSILTYRFRVFGNTTVQVGAVGQGTNPRMAYSNPFSTLSGFGDDNPHVFGIRKDTFGSAGIAFDTRVGDLFRLAYGYSTTNPQTPGTFGDSGGITGGDSAHVVELAFTPAETLTLSVRFGTGYIQNADDFGNNPFFRGPTFTPAEFDLEGSTYARINGFAIAADWEITPQVIFSGWFASSSHDYGSPVSIPGLGSNPGSETATSFLVGLLFPDLFIEGATGGFTVGQPAVSDAGSHTSRPLIIDLYYSLPVNNNLKLVPSAYFVTNPNGGSVGGANDPTIGVGAIRAEFSF